MKNVLCIMTLLAMTVTAHSQPKEVSYADIVSDPSSYVGKPIVMEGTFAYAEPMRESFTIDQNGALIEVFYRDLPGSDRKSLLAQQQYSKTLLTVSGILKQYTNKKHSYFVNATSLRLENGAAPAPSSLGLAAYSEILSNPGRYVRKPVTMKGSFVYSEPLRQSFSFDQGGNIIEVLISDLSRIDREAIFSQKKHSRKAVTVSGELLPYVNSAAKYYINASSVILEN